MAYDLDIKPEDGYIYARISGTRTKKALSEAALEILESCKEHQLSNVVVDVRELIGRIPIFESMSLVFDDFVQVKQANVIGKAAIVDSKSRRVRHGFFERIATRRGYSLRVFNDVTSAVKWLNDDKL